jgi:arylformamidase
MEFTPEFVERGYNNRAAVPDHPRWFARYAELSAAAVAALSPQRDLRYGPGPKETLDLFAPPARARGTFAFIHGGYWRALDKADFSFVATPLVADGYAVANVNYDLCPDVSISTIVGQIVRAVTWLARDGAVHGAVGPLVVGGHSAGGHLAAMLWTIDWALAGFGRAPFVAGLSLSGVHDLAPMVQFSFNADFRLDAAGAAQLSPARLEPRVDAPLLVAVGGSETSEFLRQARLQWEAWPAQRPAGSAGSLVLPGKDHFSVVADLADAQSELTRGVLALFRPRD